MTDSSVMLDEAVSSITSSLLQGVRARENEAWERFVDLYSPLVYWWCKGLGLDGAGAADVGQNVFLLVSQHVKSFRREHAGDTFRGWLRTITKNQVANHYRQMNKQPQAMGGSEAHAAIEHVTAAESDDEHIDEHIDESQEVKILYRRVVELIRGEFSETDWQAFSAYVVEGQTAADVAEDLGVSRNQVYLAKSRILARIKKEMNTNA